MVKWKEIDYLFIVKCFCNLWPSTEMHSCSQIYFRGVILCKIFQKSLTGKANPIFPCRFCCVVHFNKVFKLYMSFFIPSYQTGSNFRQCVVPWGSIPSLLPAALSLHTRFSLGLFAFAGSQGQQKPCNDTVKNVMRQNTFLKDVNSVF